MTSAAKNAASVVQFPVSDDDRWLNWLKANVDTSWRPGEWRQDIWLFTGVVGAPLSTVRKCVVVACDRVISRARLCQLCQRASRRTEQSFDEFVSAYVPQRTKVSPGEYQSRPRCVVSRDGRQCPMVSVKGGPCAYHRHKLTLRQRTNPGLTVENWLANFDVRVPHEADCAKCVVPTCERLTIVVSSTMCDMHSSRYRRSGRSQPISEWISNQTPYLSDHQFSLLHVDELLRWEVLYALQQREARGGKIDPNALRYAIARMQSAPSLSTLSEAEAVAFVDRKLQSNINAFLYEFARILRHGRDQVEGRSPMDRLVWDLVEIGIQPDPTLAGGSRRRIGLDFQPISQSWLRELALAWARHQSDAEVMADTVRVAVEVSRVLDQRHDHGARIARLTDRDAELIAQAFNRLKTPKGKLMTVKHQRHLHRRFFELITWGRDNRQLQALPRSFAPRPTHLRPFQTDPEDVVGKAIPVAIQRQLDDHIDSIGRTVPRYGQLSADDVHLMFRTAYILLRDTGRRPLEVAALGLTCLARDTSGAVLVWDNHKSKRHGRRLPILQSTADAIQRWAERRLELPVPDGSTPYLFPAIAARAREPYLRTVNLNRAIRLWVDGLERLDTNDVDDLGNPIPFDRTLIYPYAFRHSYAQRHADNGTPIDVLRDLMDHRTMETTGYYYKVTATRKRIAVDTVGKYTVDRDGKDAPSTESTAYQMRSVAVPFGNCIEPSNVKAGGHACPVRFQCAGCGFYRPDPSFIPAIEEHLNTLRSDLEIARAINTAPFVTDNLTAQIKSFNHVLTVMRERLNTLDSDEREQVEQAAAVLRRARAGAPLPLTVVNSHGQS